MLHDATTAAGYLLVLSIMAPVAGALAAIVAGGRNAQRIALATIALTMVVTGTIVVEILQTQQPLVYLLGAWAPPLGLALRADGISVAMMATTAVVITAISVFAFAGKREPTEARATFVFWILLLAVWGALNAVFTGGDFFTLYVALELLTFAAVPLVSLDGSGETLRAALRYLLFALVGTVLYLAGTAMLYGVYGTLDIVLLASRVNADPATIVAAALMTVGLLAKTALFPLHLWLPPAHAGAPAAASAVLSALVVKGPFFIVVRLWFDVMPTIPVGGAQILGALGAAAILFGSVVALRQTRLKLLIAYSTVAQIGYLFLMFPLARDPEATHLLSGGALTGGMMQAISHASAKGAMFLAAGVVLTALGHDRIAGLVGIARTLPVTMFAFALAGASLIGLPPTGGFLAKWLLLQAAVTTGQWWWALTVLTGGLLTSAYVFTVIARAIAVDNALPAIAPVPRHQETAALALALCSLFLGFAAFSPIDILMGRAP